FQAEDGIRAATVTGVQTCALPISFWGTRLSPGCEVRMNLSLAGMSFGAANRVSQNGRLAEGSSLALISPRMPMAIYCSGCQHIRSEERRVGKQCSTVCKRHVLWCK